MLKFVGMLVCLLCAVSTSLTQACTQAESPSFAAIQGDTPNQLLAELESEIDLDFTIASTIAAFSKPFQAPYLNALSVFVNPNFSLSSIRAPPAVR